MRRLALLLAAAPLLLACSHAPAYKAVTWPAPPEKPRIRFVRTFSSSEDVDDSSWSRVKRAALGAGPSITLRQPMGLAVSPDGKRLYIADHMLAHVVVADLEKRRLETFAPQDPQGLVLGVALDGDENVYVTETKNHEVLVFDRSGKRIRQFGMNDLVRPTGIAVDARRQLAYVVDSANQASDEHRVLVYSLKGELLRELGPEDDEPGRGSAPGQFHFPSYVALDGRGNVYVADTMNFRIQVFDPDGKFLRAYGEMGDGPGTFNKLKGLAVDGFGNVYAVDTAHASVQIFNPDFEALMYFGGPAPFAEYMQLPTAIAIDGARNRIYVANTGSPRVSVYDLINTEAADSTPPPAPPARAD